jgi:hypothetical protein
MGEEQKETITEKQLHRRIFWHTLLTYVYFSAAIAGVISVIFASHGFTTGSIRYGIILPIYFIYNGFKSLRVLTEYKELRNTLNYIKNLQNTPNDKEEEDS